MLHVVEHGEGVLDDLVGLAAFDVNNEADPAGIVFIRRVIEPLRGGLARYQVVAEMGHGNLRKVKV
jgi:hypothetical protein